MRIGRNADVKVTVKKTSLRKDFHTVADEGRRKADVRRDEQEADRRTLRTEQRSKKVSSVNQHHGSSIFLRQQSFGRIFPNFPRFQNHFSLTFHLKYTHINMFLL